VTRKSTQIGIFGLKTNHLATLGETPRPHFKGLRRNFRHFAVLRAALHFRSKQGDQIGRIYAQGAIVNFGLFFENYKSSKNFLFMYLFPL
jgi:hypothetical protein